MKQAVEPYFRPSAKKQVKLKELRMYKIEATDPRVSVRDSYSGAWRKVDIRNKKRIQEEMTLTPLYNEGIQINPAKAQGLRSLYSFLEKEESRVFYENLIGTIESAEDRSGPEVIDSDNSSGEEEQ